MTLRIGPNVRMGCAFLSLGFNQDGGCFAVGTSEGFRIFNTDPFDEQFGRKFASGGIGVVEMLYRTNILALVGGGAIPAFPPNQVIFWDDHAMAAVGQLTFPEVVLSVKLRRDKIVVVTKSNVFIYNFDNFDLIAKHPTADNANGVVALSTSPSHAVLATLARQVGYARVENYSARKSIMFKAHESAIRFMALTPDGSLLATCSEKGTIIRIFDTSSDCAAPIAELRRGTQPADIYSIAFSHDGTMLAAYSDKGTLHLFVNPVKTRQPSSAASGSEDVVQNQKSMFSFASSFLPRYFSSEWSFANWKGPEVPAICAFGSNPNTIILTTCEGEYFEVTYDPVKNSMNSTAFHRFKESKLSLNESSAVPA
eukprot:ANDGO_06978.mRNA.1 Autophagy-related protein 18a